MKKLFVTLGAIGLSLKHGLIIIVVLASLVSSQRLTLAQSDPCDKYYNKGYCTDYVRMKTRAPLPAAGKSGGPLNWWNNPGSLKKGSLPAVGAIVILRPPRIPTGHTGIVESIAADGKSFTMSQWNYGATMRDAACLVTDKFHEITTSTWNLTSPQLVGFIYPPGVTPPSANLFPLGGDVVLSAALQSETFIDGTQVARGQTFTKEWTLRNTGSREWFVGYRLRYLTGTLSVAHTSVLVSKAVPPGGSFPFRVAMRAPTTPGVYQEDWQLETTDGRVIKVGSSPKIWARILVR